MKNGKKGLGAVRYDFPRPHVKTIDLTPHSGAGDRILAGAAGDENEVADDHAPGELGRFLRHMRKSQPLAVPVLRKIFHFPVHLPASFLHALDNPRAPRGMGIQGRVFVNTPRASFDTWR